MIMRLKPQEGDKGYVTGGLEIKLADHDGVRLRNPRRCLAGDFFAGKSPVPVTEYGVAVKVDQGKGRRWLLVWIPEATYRTCVYKERRDAVAGSGYRRR